MNIRPKRYKMFNFIPYKRCYNIESENPDYKFLFTAHYDTHGGRQNYIQSFINRNVQFSTLSFLGILYIFSLAIVFFLFLFILVYIAKMKMFVSIFLSFLPVVFIAMGMPVSITSIFSPFKSAPVHDDNNSGVITLIHLAKVLDNKGYSNRIKLLFTDCEENGMLGSKLFVKDNLDDLKDKIIINFDCVGKGSNLFITTKNNSIEAKELQCLLLSKGINTVLHHKSFSDDKSFQKNQLNAFGLIRADKNHKGHTIINWTHTNHDILDNINIDYIIELIEVITEFIESKIESLALS